MSMALGQFGQPSNGRFAQTKNSSPQTTSTRHLAIEQPACSHFEPAQVFRRVPDHRVIDAVRPEHRRNVARWRVQHRLRKNDRARRVRVIQNLAVEPPAVAHAATVKRHHDAQRSRPRRTRAARASPSASGSRRHESPDRTRPTQSRIAQHRHLHLRLRHRAHHGSAARSRPGRSRLSTGNPAPAATAAKNASRPQPAGETAPVPNTTIRSHPSHHLLDHQCRVRTPEPERVRQHAGHVRVAWHPTR